MKITEVWFKEDGFLYARDEAGHELRVYAYGPLVSEGVEEQKIDIPFIDQWDLFKQVILQFTPIPAENVTVPPQLNFRFQTRPEGRWHYDQLLYEGYPLFVSVRHDGLDVLHYSGSPEDQLFTLVKKGFKNGPVRGFILGSRPTRPESIGP